MATGCNGFQMLSNNDCAKQNNYLDILKTKRLASSGNSNAKIDAEVAAWADVAQASSSILNDLKRAGRLNGPLVEYNL
ncbi:unnamed protein product [Aphanomyces euteiches]